MNSLSRIVRYIFSAILLSGILSLLRLSFGTLQIPAARRPAPSPRPLPLFRDPFCGIFVSPEVSVHAQCAGQIEYFCSEQCRDRYLSGSRQAIRA